MKLNKLILVCPALLVVGACSDSTDYNFETSQMLVEEQAASMQSAGTGFDLQSDPPVLPFPNSLLFGADGTLDIPLPDGVTADNIAHPVVVLNAMDGYSTTQPITTSFDAPMDVTSFNLGDTVRVFEVTTLPTNGAVIGVVGELGASDVTLALLEEQTLAIVPLRPLKESTDYMVIVTKDVKNANGIETGPSPSFRLVSGNEVLTDTLGALAESVRQLTGTYLAAAEGAGVARSDIILAWTTKTQSITPTMTAVAAAAQSFNGNLGVAPTGLTTKAVLDPANQNPGVFGVADVLIGTLDVPYYRTAPADANDPTGVVSYWQPPGGGNITRFQPMPEATSTQTIPVLMTVPNAASGQTQPTAGWPLVIFVHGITQDRTNMFAIAEAMAGVGFAVIAIDQPMHGILDPTSALNAANSPFPTDVERHYNLDILDANGAPGKDDVPESSGFHFYSPGNLLASRDNLRQGAADLLILSASVGNLPQIDGSRKALVGHSLGGVVATTFLAFDSSIQSATLAMPAAGLAPMLLASERFGQDIIDGIAAQGVAVGSPDFNQLILAAQTLIDSGDSINHAAAAAASTPIHMVEIVGDGTEAVPSDTTVPNSVAGAPLSGTDPLARMMGFDPNNPVTADFAGAGLVQFIAGDHSSLLDPTASLAATIEIQTQMAVFAATQGTSIDITDTSVVKGAQ